MGRVEDANKHVDELNRMYLSTIETLAMAMDAKDHVTHGHIRRVQAYSVFLAKQLGVNDQRVVKALEAAALLHDMGKLAIPDRILNKPGKLTTAEYEIVKLHSAVGADILAAIEFPFPVVPIVRHHHENWDGSGYPDGLAGTDIPIGARILSVVDCFDALTSDRPYRSKLPDDAALAILKNRRGAMYDPVVVDALLEIHGATVVPVERPPVETVILTARMKLGRDLTSASTDSDANEAVFGPTTTTPEVQMAPYSVEVTASYITKLFRGCLLVLYAIDEAASTLCVVRAWGRGATVAQRLRIPFGGGVSGSAASTSRAIYRADASLDFADDMKLPMAAFGTCSATPVVADGHILGVLTIYLSETAPTLDMPDRSFESAGAHFSAYLSSLHRSC
jgi:putative nucleotidyltransferase with HDIG domain